MTQELVEEAQELSGLTVQDRWFDVRRGPALDFDYEE